VSLPELRKVGRYEILAKVGQGAMGAVFRAQDPTIRRVVALKVIAANPIGSDVETAGGGRLSSAAFFEREAQAAGSLLHPNIVTLYDAGRDGDWYYLAMEFVEGINFAAEIARDGKVSVDRAAEVGAVVAEALDFAHERGVVHRDIKPANLMILPDSTVKVADFGIARLTSAASSTMTTDMMVGTPQYMSPEQVKGGNVDGRSDLYSLAVVLYEALTGRKPFAAESLPALLHVILRSGAVPVRQVDPAIPAELSGIVARAMSGDPGKRQARGKDLAAELRAFRERSRGAPADGRRSGIGLKAGIAASLCLVIAVAGAWGVGLFEHTALAPAAPNGFVEFVSNPRGADILLDGKVIGRTGDAPFTAEVPAGTHEIEMRKDGYYPAPATVKVPANERVPVELDLEARE
jgi:serine/threonine-protein kinase